MFSPKAIANFFLSLAKQSGEAITPMKLQKLVYYAHGWFAGHTGTPLINETVEAWQYGPVINSLYHEFKRFGSGAISAKATDFDPVDFELVEVPVPEDPVILQYLRNVWASYGKFTATRLSEMTHSVDSPWDQTWRKNVGVRGADIPFELIRDHFKVAAQKSAERSTEKG